MFELYLKKFPVSNFKIKYLLKYSLIILHFNPCRNFPSKTLNKKKFFTPMKKLSEDAKKRVLSYKNSKIGYREIARLTGVCISQIHMIFKDAKIIPEKGILGLKKKLSKRKEDLIVRKFNEDLFLTATEAVRWVYKEFNITVSAETIRKVLKKHGIKSFKKHTKPLLTAKHIRERLKFAKATKKYTYDDWQKVLFSDESKYNLHSADGNQRVWCKDNMRLTQKNIIGVKKFGGGNVMIWGILTKNGVGKPLRVSNSMNSKEYCNVLRNGLIETSNMHDLKISQVIFMQDNASCHKSAETTNWLRTHNINTLKWPACSPDLNIIENVWAYLENGLELET